MFLVLDDGRRLVGIEILFEAWPGQNVGDLGHLSRGRNEFDLAPEPCLIQPVRRSALGDQCGDRDVCIKYDPHAPRSPLRRSDQGSPAGRIERYVL